MNLNRRILIKFYKLFDLLVMLVSFAAATYATYDHYDGGISLENFLSMRIRVQNFILFLGLLLSWQFIFSAFGVYLSKRLAGRVKESLDLTKATSVGTLTCWVFAAVFDMSMITPEFLFLFWVVSSAVCIASRLILRQILKWLRLRGRNLRFMLIVGTNKRAVRFAERIQSRPDLGYSLLGFVENHWRGNPDFPNSSSGRIVTDFEGFASFVRENVVDEVVVCLPVRSLYNQIFAISRICEEQGIIFRHFSGLYDSKRAHSRTDHLEGESLVTLYTGSMTGWQILMKRIVDILLCLFLLAVFSPLFLVSVWLIKRSSPGPVFFVQERVGLNKRRFCLYKFRTMIADAEKKLAELEDLNELSGPVFKIKNDPRITPIGKFLRKTSIDELPQLYNVLIGDMSLVGPRALPVRDYNGFDQDWHRRRFSVRPGITCLWQVNGRNDIPFDKWMELDLEYIDKWSLWLDFKILLRTIPAVVSGHGAA
jgi:exopolysaccharide biosynthesis polyprenyl glycosylphosphotransferase